MSQQRRERMPQNRLTLGKYVLDSLSAGMYSHPLMSLREYVQNSADAIDQLPGSSEQASVDVLIDGRGRSLSIRDDGVGISCDKARSTLLNVGCSDKDPAVHRGFRGIGRLGGLGYCDELRFTTKSQGEDRVSVCTWDCRKLKQLVADSSQVIDAQSLIEDVSRFEQQKHTGSRAEHFFSVEMNVIRDGQNELLNVPIIKSYLSQVAPVPFHPGFAFGYIIDHELASRAISCRTYRLLVNGEQVYRPYRNIVTLSRGSSESVRDVTFAELKGQSGLLALAWLADLGLRGTISVSSHMDGLRLRYGNIMMGNKDTLSRFFRERRFNNYLMGEVHVCPSVLTPNSRRDDFEESDQKDELLTAFIRELGIPLSSQIRQLSSQRSKRQNCSNRAVLFETAARVMKYGYISRAHREHIIKGLTAVSGNDSPDDSRQATDLLAGLAACQDFLSVIGTGNHSDDHVAHLLIAAIEAAYSRAEDRTEADRLIDGIYEAASKRS